jgi:hypothetical protein
MTEGDTSPPAQEFEVVTEALLHGRQAKIGGVIEAELEGIQELFQQQLVVSHGESEVEDGQETVVTGSDSEVSRDSWLEEIMATREAAEKDATKNIMEVFLEGMKD